MEQEIRFCTTSDGVRLAYATMGEGLPVVRVLGWFTHLELEWQMGRPNIEWLAQNHKYVRFDGRGMGLSDREVADFSSQAHVRDLEAVVDDLGLKRFALIAWSQGGPTAIRYVVENPRRVSRLVLYGSFARNPSKASPAMNEAMITMMREGWESDRISGFFAELFMPDADPSAMSLFKEFQRASTPARNAAAIIEEIVMRADVRDLLPKVKVPTLVIHRRDDEAVSFEAGRELAAMIPGARFLPLEGRNHAMLPDEPELEIYKQAVDEFLSEDRKPARGRPTKPPAPSGLVTVLFTDMEGSTTLTQRLGDAQAQELLRTHNAIVRDALKAHEGSEIKHTGDGVMASFNSASKALQCAAAIQDALASHNESSPDTPIHVRIGVNAGEPVAEDADLFGTAVQMAARICAHAEPGQVLAANVVRELAAGKGFLFSDVGDVELRGFEDPVRLYIVRSGEGG